MSAIRRYLVYARAPFATASFLPVLLGTALAWRVTQVFSPIDFALNLAGVVLAHLGINLSNDYFDFRQGADQHNPHRNPFSGGSPHLVDGSERPDHIRNLAWGTLGVACACGVALAVRVDRGLGPIVWLMLAGFVGGYFYTAPPLKFAYRGWGELFILLNFGFLSVLGSFYVQSNVLAWSPLIVSIPLGLLIVNVLWINQFPDFESDRDSGKHTLVVRLHPRWARFVYAALLAVVGAVLLAMPACLAVSRWVYLAFLGALPAGIAAWTLFRHYDNPPKLRTAQALTILAHLLSGLLMTLGILLGP